MNNKGFIATSLIYSFFLIFITLFLTIIADYLQDKVLLNTIENGIKDILNNTMTINDFEVGDILVFDEDSDSSINFSHKYDDLKDDIWIVSKVNTNENKIVLYSYGASYSYESNDKLTLNDVYNDLSYGGYLNDTYLSKIIYTSQFKFGLIENHMSSYSFDLNTFILNLDYLNKIISEAGCLDTYECNLYYEDDYGCRLRKEVNIGTDKLIKGETSPDGSITLIGVE
ncbi:MAG: hypothetical protein IJD92_02655 [Bacilli bacterium]|nr:hypothetical protein [Bacilli bacterium]